jgi:hypothetical protein
LETIKVVKKASHSAVNSENILVVCWAAYLAVYLVAKSTEKMELHWAVQ